MLVVIGFDYAGLWRWEDFDPSRLSSLMRSFDAPWWVVGGRALELWMGRQTCAHQVVDVAFLRDETSSSFTRPSVVGLGTVPMSVGPWAAAEVAAPAAGVGDRPAGGRHELPVIARRVKR